MSAKFDAVIVGAALNGLAAVLALAGPQARRPLSVAIIEAKDPHRFGSDVFDGRASAITASSRMMFEALDVWRDLAPQAEPMREIVVTDSRGGAEERPALLHFGEAEIPGEPSAYMVENRHLYRVLLDRVLAGKIEIRADTEVGHYRFGPGLARLETKAGEEIRTSLIIAADGRQSPAREAAGIKIFGWEYGQAGIVTAVSHELPHHGRAEEHFLPAGPFAILPLTGSRSSLVWTERTEDAARIMALDDQGFAEELKARFGSHLGRVSVIGARHSYPLSMFLAERFVGERLALIGDAAHVVHPIAGLGFNLGLRDAAALAECIADAARLGLDIGSAAVLERYQRWRRVDTTLTAVATDGLNRLFSNDIAGLRALRDAGLRVVNAAAPLKTLFMREAAGQTGRLPKLLMGEAV